MHNNHSQKIITYKDENNLFWFKINRPDKRNAVDYDVMNELKKAIANAKNDTSIRAFVITGTGDHSFCSGGDLSVFHALHTKEEAFSMLSKMANILYSLMTIPMPTFALINGTAVGGGCEIAAACDFRLAVPHAKVGFIQGKLGITTGWGGASMLFEKATGPNALKMLSSSAIYTAEEAKELGFIQKIIQKHEDEASSNSDIDQYIISSANVLRSYKKALIAKWDHTNLKDRMLAEVTQCSILWEQDEHHDAVADFLKRKKK